MSHVLITGSASGLGQDLVTVLAGEGHVITEFDAVYGQDVRCPDATFFDKLEWLDVLINCAGVNKINWLEDVSLGEWDEVMDVNAKGIFRMSQACLPLLKKSYGTIVNIVSNAAHMPMTCSLAYNASKGAAHIMTKQLARELTRKHNITVFGVAPNKLAGTGMSKDIDDQVMRTRGWTEEYAKQYQLNGLLTEQETPVYLVAEFIAYLLQSKSHHKYLTGCVIPYGA